jgi:hypothetical protein
MQIHLSPAHPDSNKVDRSTLEDRIRNRAYQIYVQRGSEDGHALDDWLNAKAEVLGVVKSSASA